MINEPISISANISMNRAAVAAAVAGEGDVSGCGGDRWGMRPRGMARGGLRRSFAKDAHGAPQTSGIRQKAPARAVAVPFPGPRRSPRTSPPRLPSPSFSQRFLLHHLGAIYSRKAHFWGGHLMITSNFSTEFPALLQPYDSTTEQGPRAAGCNPASRQGPATSPLIPRVLSLPFARGEPVGLGWVFLAALRYFAVFSRV